MKRTSYIAGALIGANLMLAGTLAAEPAPQQKATPAQKAPTNIVPDPNQSAAPPFQLDANQTRRQLQAILKQYPPSLDDVLRIDNTLLTNGDYLAMYPSLKEFLAQHPEVAHNPSFFIGSPDYRREDQQSESYRMWRDATEAISIFAVMASIAGLFLWLTKTGIDYRRWLRVSRLQEQVHSKLMDRLTSNEDLLAYIQTPAGKRFLESAPLPLDAGAPPLSAPLGRILWSAQMGLVLAFGGLGLNYAFSRLTPDRATEPFFVISVLAVALGLGFIVSAAVAYMFSQRLGLIDLAGKQPADVNKQTLT